MESLWNAREEVWQLAGYAAGKEFQMDNTVFSSAAIYGAGMVAVSVYYAVKTLYKETEVLCFIVKEQLGNPASIDGVPVVTLDCFKEGGISGIRKENAGCFPERRTEENGKKERREAPEKEIGIIIATPENHHASIIEDLKERGFHNYICIDSGKEADLMGRYYGRTGGFPLLRSCPPGAQDPEVSVYMSKFYKDQPLQGDYPVPAWLHPIQAGASLTELRVADICDNAGDNISVKNVNYSELSAMYWIWKHADAEYLGLFHYRRILDIKEEDFRRLGENDIDVVLPYPSVYFPNIEGHHKRYVEDSDWEAMVKALEECAPEYAAALPGIFAGQYFYNYNILVAKRQVFKDYCSWLFPVLERTEELSVPKGKERADRYIGYLGENLTTLYFLYHSKDYRIVHTGRRMLV